MVRSAACGLARSLTRAPRRGYTRPVVCDPHMATPAERRPRSMTAPTRPLVVISGKINPAGIKQLESEARVVITPDQETKTVIELAREADGILFRAGPRCDDVILDACPRVRVVGRPGVGLDTGDLDSATG